MVGKKTNMTDDNDNDDNKLNEGRADDDETIGTRLFNLTADDANLAFAEFLARRGMPVARVTSVQSSITTDDDGAVVSVQVTVTGLEA